MSQPRNAVVAESTIVDVGCDLPESMWAAFPQAVAACGDEIALLILVDGTETGTGEDGGGGTNPPEEWTGTGEDGGGGSAPPEETGTGEDGGGGSAPPETGTGEDGGGGSAPPEERAYAGRVATLHRA